MRRFLPALICAATLLGGSAAAAPATPHAAPPAVSTAVLRAPPGAGDCIWAAVPQDVRDAVAAAQTIDVVAEAIKELGSDHAGQLALAEHCGVRQAGADPAQVVQRAIEAKTMDIWTTRQLKTAYGVSDDQLSQAWAQVSVRDRTAFARWFGAGFNTPDAGTDRVRTLMGGLGLTGDDAASLVIYYAGARAAFERLGGTG